MSKFSASSSARLSECDPRLQTVFNKVLESYDCTIVVGYRGEKEQNDAFEHGLSKLRFPDSKHNKSPSLAVDAAPFPVKWDHKNSFYHFAGYVLGVAEGLGIKLRWGGDWDGDRDLADQSFYDLVHFELVEDAAPIASPT